MAKSYDEELAEFAQRQEVRAKYAEMKAIAEAATLVPVPTRNLEQELAEDYKEPVWRIRNLHIASSFTTITAAKKTGKSTLMLNLIRSLVDGVPFLGEPVLPLVGNVGYLNMELDPNVWRRWAKEIGIEHAKRIKPWHLRGERFPIYHPELQKRMVEWLKAEEIEVLIIDPGHRLLRGWPTPNGGGENSNDIVAAVCQKLQEIKREGEVVDLFVPLHTGHASGEHQHTRGAIMWQDDPDHLWNLWSKEVVKGDGGVRHFNAEGRDVDFQTTGIKYDKTTHRYEPASIEYMQNTGRVHSVVIALSKLGGTASTRDVRARKLGFGNDLFTGVLQDAKERGLIVTEGSALKLADTEEVRKIVMFGDPEKEVE